MATPPNYRDGQGIYYIERGVIMNLFLLSNIPVLTKIFQFLLGHTAAKYGIAVTSATLVPNGYRLVASETGGNSDISHFIQALNSSLAKVVNRLHNRSGTFWDSNVKTTRRLNSRRAILHAIVKCQTSPTSLGFSECSEQFAGLLFNSESIGNSSEKIERPIELGTRSTLPKSVTLKSELPRKFPKTCKKRFHSKIVKRVKETQADLIKQSNENRIEFLNERLFEIQTTDSPATYDLSIELQTKAQTQELAKIAASRQQRLYEQKYRRFQKKYRISIARWIKDKSAPFPVGTQKMKNQFAVICTIEIESDSNNFHDSKRQNRRDRSSPKDRPQIVE